MARKTPKYVDVLNYEHLAIINAMYLHADDYKASTDWIRDWSSADFSDIKQLTALKFFEYIGKNDSGDKIYELTKKGIRVGKYLKRTKWGDYN